MRRIEVSLTDLDTRQKRLKYLYERNGCENKAAFCDKHMLSRTTFYKVWNGRGENLKLDTMDAFARALNVSTDFFAYGGTELGFYREHTITGEDGDYLVRIPKFTDVTPEKCINMARAYVYECNERELKEFMFLLKILKYMRIFGREK